MKIYQLLKAELSNKYTICIIIFLVAVIFTDAFKDLIHNIVNDQQLIDSFTSVISYCVISRVHQIFTNYNK